MVAKVLFYVQYLQQLESVVLWAVKVQTTKTKFQGKKLNLEALKFDKKIYYGSGTSECLRSHEQLNDQNRRHLRYRAIFNTCYLSIFVINLQKRKYDCTKSAIECNYAVQYIKNKRFYRTIEFHFFWFVHLLWKYRLLDKLTFCSQPEALCNGPFF